MAGFLAPLRIEELPGEDRRWRLLEPCLYHLHAPDGAEWVEVPAGFVTDFGSIPRLLWAVPGLSPFGRYRRAFAVHDKLYVAPVVRRRMGARVVTRGEADAILREALEVLGAWWGTRQTIWSGVRAGGWWPWSRYRDADHRTKE
jgi:hypothetical protein